MQRAATYRHQKTIISAQVVAGRIKAIEEMEKKDKQITATGGGMNRWRCAQDKEVAKLNQSTLFLYTKGDCCPIETPEL